MPRLPLRGGRGRTLSGGGLVGGRGHDDSVRAGRGNRGGRHQRGLHPPPPMPIPLLLPPAPPPPHAPPLNMLNEEAVLSLGLSLVGFPDFRQRSEVVNVRRFRAFYGVSPKALAALYADLYNIMPKMDTTKFFMTINWLKLYDSEHVLSGRWMLNEDTLRLQIREYVANIQQLKELKVQWGGFDDDEVFIISVDGIHCRIQEVRKDPGAKWYSHKTNSAGVTYELGIAIRSNRLVWIKGPFPASRHDITTFRSPDDPVNGLKAQIPEHKRAIGDSGYKGEPKITVTRAGDSREVKHFKGRVKSRHETFNSRLKSFKILDSTFRHGFEQHQKAFESVCICVQYDIENGHGLFEV